jgi:cysteine synthase B
MHGLEGWKHLETAHVPAIFDPYLAHETRFVDTLEAWDMVRQLARQEGLLVSPSAAANLVGSIRVAESIDEGVIVTTFADSADKYADVMDHIFS